MRAPSRPAASTARRTFARLRPTFMMTAASERFSRSVSAASSSVPGMTVSTSSPQVIGALARVQHPDMPGDARHDLDRERAFEPAPHVHERAVEERVALGQQPDGGAALQLAA